MSATTNLTWESDYKGIRKTIAESYLASGLDPAAIDQLAALGIRRRYAVGEVIVRQDDPEEHLLIMAKGRAEISTFMDEPLYYLRPGMPFGEIALIDEKPRSATVRAQEATEVVLLPAPELRSLMYAQPALGLVVLRNLARVLCSRVRASNQQIAALLTIEELRDGRS
ncbi:MAG: Crp/Fnr family transcriptional regulator [Fimbriimonadaceae bacterium]